jgi:hypothetical protein
MTHEGRGSSLEGLKPRFGAKETPMICLPQHNQQPIRKLRIPQEIVQLFPEG